MKPRLYALLIEDDSQDMAQYLRDFPKLVDDQEIVYDPCNSFDAALEMIERKRYDVILSDTYRGRFKNAIESKPAALDLVHGQLQNKRFCPMIIFSNGVRPDDLNDDGVFLRWVDKTEADGIENAIVDIIRTGIPALARKLHDDLDQYAGSYLWDFLRSNWLSLQASHFRDATLLERLVRRRAGYLLSSLDISSEQTREVQAVVGAEYYVYPSPRVHYSLGEIVRSKENNEFRVVLTPHCHLVPQSNGAPRADLILTAKAISCDSVFSRDSGKQAGGWGTDEVAQVENLRRRTQSPSQYGQPSGRYWYLPAFLDIPHLYCDFMAIESIPMKGLKEKFERICVLDSPYSEALQACFGRFYAAVGLPSLDTNTTSDMIPSGHRKTK